MGAVLGVTTLGLPALDGAGDPGAPLTRAASASPPAAAPVARVLPAAEASSAAVVSFEPGRRDLFWTSGERLRHRFLPAGGSWSRQHTRGGSLASQPAAVSWGPGRVDVFARGTDDRLKWRTRRPSGWSPWRSLGGRLSAAPGVASWQPGRLDVFVRWTDDALYQRTYTSGTWSAWTRRGGTLTSSPAATSWGTGRVDVVARTTGHDLLHRAFAGGRWRAWENLGGRWTAQPTVASPAPGRLDVALRGGAGRMNVRRYVSGSGWARAVRLGDDVFTSGPGATAVGDDVRLVARRADGSLAEIVRPSPGAAWRSWRAVDPHAPFRRLGTWVDVFDYASLDPATAVADMKARGVRTLYLSTARWRTPLDPAADFYDEAEAGAWLDEAHAAGIRVVGWYVPAYGDMARDVRRVEAVDDYVSPGGQRFDAVGVDIERYRAPGEPETAGEVGHATFNVRAVEHLREVRARTSAVLGAIVPSPFTTDPGNRWDGFPWVAIGGQSDVVVTMALWSFRQNTNGSPFNGSQVYSWVRDQVDRAEALSGRPVHVEGGSNDDPDDPERTPITVARVTRFVEAARDAGAVGGSHYDYLTTFDEVTGAPLWPALAGLN